MGYSPPCRRQHHMFKVDSCALCLVTSARRSAAYPDLPTVAEAGVSGYVVEGWYGLVCPGGNGSGHSEPVEHVGSEKQFERVSLRRLKPTKV